MTTKEDVLQFLAKEHALPSEQFNEGFRLYQKSRNKNLAQERFLNKVGYTPTTLSTVLYEIKKLHNISPADVVNYKAEQPDTPVFSIAPADDTPADEDLDIDEASLIELQDQIQKEVEQNEALKNEIKFRDEFTFLNGPNVPDELKILVADKFTHYHAFAEAHRALAGKVLVVVGEPTEAQLDKVVYDLAKQAVENFQGDQLIYDELKHYQDHGTVLGVHPIFKERELKNQVEKMTIAETAKRKSLLENYIRRDSNNIEKAKSDEERTKFTDKVALWNKELVLVKLKLGESVS